VCAARARVAGIRGAGVPVVAFERGAGSTGPALTGLGAVAGVAIAAGGAVRHGGRLAMAGGARVGGAGVPVVALAVRRAGGAAGDRGVCAARARVAGIRGAGVPVVAVERGPGLAGAALTGLEAVAGVAVATGRAVRHGGRLTAAGGARVGGAGVPVVALARRRASGAAGDGRMNAAGARVAAVGGAGVAVVAVERGPRVANACRARFNPVTGVSVVAGDLGARASGRVDCGSGCRPLTLVLSIANAVAVGVGVVGIRLAGIDDPVEVHVLRRVCQAVAVRIHQRSHLRVANRHLVGEPALGSARRVCRHGEDVVGANGETAGGDAHRPVRCGRRHARLLRGAVAAARSAFVDSVARDRGIATGLPAHVGGVRRGKRGERYRCKDPYERAKRLP